MLKSSSRGALRRRGISRFNANSRFDQTLQAPDPVEIVRENSKAPSHLPGWTLYLPTTEYDQKSNNIDKLIESLGCYLRNQFLHSSLDIILENRSIRIDLESLVNADIDFRLDDFENIQCALHSDPVRMRNLIGLAAYKLVYEMEQQRMCELKDGIVSHMGVHVELPPLIHPELFNWPHSPTRIRDIKAQCLGRLVSVFGTVSSVSAIKPLCIQLAYECARCSSRFAIVQAVRAKQMSQPTCCVHGHCRSHSFCPIFDSVLTKLVDFQVIKVQAHQDELDDPSGDRIPRSIEAELMGPLVDKCGPGDNVVVCGAVKIKQERDQAGGVGSRTRESFTLCIEAFSVEQRDRCGYGGLNISSDLSIKELYGIRKLHSEGEHLFDLLVASICPSIFGYKIAKAGVLLSMFSGKQTHVENSKLPTSVARTNIHCLLVGDPGTGKSQILKACASLAPRAIYVCGNTSTTAGLTVAVGRSTNQGGDFAIESGALVMADSGICCIDELDKIAHSSLLEAMEQQFVSVAKAGVVCSIPSRCSVIAAANPLCGHYDRSRKLLENIKLRPALVSRFDLIFVMVDEPNHKSDMELSRFLMNKYESPHKDSVATDENNSDFNETMISAEDLVPASMIRKYIAYSLKHVKEPSLSPAAANILKDFYLDARRNCNASALPITLRFLESLVRLCKAIARLHLREKCTVKDANDTVSIMKYCVDQLNHCDFDAPNEYNGEKSRGSSKAKTMIRIFTNRRKNDHITIDELKEISEDANMEHDEFIASLSALNECGTLIKRGRHLFQFSDSAEL